MDRKVAVPGVKPGGLSQLPHGLQAKKSVSLNSPATFPAQPAGENVGDRVDVGRDVQPPPQQVVASIDHDCDFVGGNDLTEAIDELCASRPSAQDADHAALRTNPSAAAAAHSFSDNSPGRATTPRRNSG